jgi:ssDNA-binding Zn-finger/Zn-ribbon topoisomerase 1
MKKILDMEEGSVPCPRNPRHRLQVRQGNTGYFWGCEAYPGCLYTRPLTASELARLE